MMSGVGDYHQNSCRPCGLRVVCSSKVHCALCVQYHGTIVSISIYTSYQTDFSPSTLDDYRKLWRTLQDDMTQKRNDTRLVRARCYGGWRLFLCLTRVGWPAARRAHLARSHPRGVPWACSRPRGACRHAAGPAAGCRLSRGPFIGLGRPSPRPSRPHSATPR